MPGAGTEIEDRTEGGTRGLYEAEVRQVLDARPALWGPGERWRSYEAFVRAAGLVQSRSFHVNTENWLTGQCTEGGTSAPAMLSSTSAPQSTCPAVFDALHQPQGLGRVGLESHTLPWQGTYLHTAKRQHMLAR